jgi:hypothetical protein
MQKGYFETISILQFRSAQNEVFQMKLYHYTKGISFAQILHDGHIETGRNSGITRITRIQKLTNFVWLTEKASFPITALPLLPGIPGTNLHLQLLSGGTLDVDYESIGKIFGGLFRIRFDSQDKRFLKWRGSNERNAMLRNPEWVVMEKIANRVRDNISKYWIAPQKVDLVNCTVEIYMQGAWVEFISADKNGDLIEHDGRRLFDAMRQGTLALRRAAGFEFRDAA